MGDLEPFAHERTNEPTLNSYITYTGTANSVCWEGRVVGNMDRFKRYMRAVVQPRIADDELSFDTDMRGLATTGMATQYVERMLNAMFEPEAWEVGEALAECALRDDSDRQIHWPWNTVRDRRTPRASLPGADLVGFCCEDGNVALLFGEVKTSSDTNSPPGVMSGKSGMTWQLERIANCLEAQRTLLQWLLARCRDQPYRDFYQKAVKRYLASEGKDVLLIGVLIRDTRPNDRDLEARGIRLSEQFSYPTRIELIAWYLPVSIANWPTLLRGAVS